MTYALGRLVNVWMGLYYNLFRVRSWARKEQRTPSITDALDFLSRQNFRRTEETLYWRMRNVFDTLKQYKCNKTLETLEESWSVAQASQDIRFKTPVEATSLIDFPRYLGASWPHNDVAVYIPSLSKTAVMKLSDARFAFLRNRLMTLTYGMDPFIGTAFEISNSGLNPVFNRIRCSRARPIDPKSFKSLGSFKAQLDHLSGSYVDGHHLASQFSGDTKLELSRSIIARYGRNYALMQFLVADAEVVTVDRSVEQDYKFKFKVDGRELSGWMFRNSLFDPKARPEKYGGSKCRFAAFAVIGNSALDEYRFHLHVIGICPTDDLGALEPLAEPNSMAYTVSAVEEELIQLDKEIRGQLEPSKVELDLREELILREDSELPPTPLVKERELPVLEARTLIILNGSRNDGLTLPEIANRVRQEGIKDADASTIRRTLESLATRELVAQNVFGDVWYVNPAVRIQQSEIPISQGAVEERVLEFLRAVYPNKFQVRNLIGKFRRDDSRITPLLVSRAISRLVAQRRLLQDGTGKCYANLYPPRTTSSKPSEPSKPSKASNRSPDDVGKITIQLEEWQLRRIPLVGFAQGNTVYVFKEKKVAKQLFILSPEDSQAKIGQLLSDIRSGRYSAIEFEDQVNGTFRIESEAGSLRGTYANSSGDVVRFVLRKLSRENEHN